MTGKSVPILPLVYRVRAACQPLYQRFDVADWQRRSPLNHGKQERAPLLLVRTGLPLVLSPGDVRNPELIVTKIPQVSRDWAV